MAGLFRSWGYETADRGVRRPLPHAQGAPARDGRADPLHGDASPSRRSPEDSTSGQTAEQLPALQRLLDRRRRDRRARLRQLRRAQGLRGARSGTASTSRARSSSRATAARGAASSPRSRPSTARSAASSTPIRTTTATSRATSIPRAPAATSSGAPARLGRGHAALPGRSADARRRRHRGRQAARRQGRADAHQDPRAADLLRRRPAAAQGARRPGGAGGLARRAPHHLPPRPRPGARPSEAGVQLEAEARSTT